MLSHRAGTTHQPRQLLSDLPNFIVEGEQRYWVHVAIDRFTGQVIDQQVEDGERVMDQRLEAVNE